MYIEWKRKPVIIIIVGSIDLDPIMRLSARRDSPGTEMGQYPKSTRHSVTKVGDMQA